VKYLAPGQRCSAYWYAAAARLLTGSSIWDDLDFLKELGLRAARLARWEGIAPWQVPEGPYWVHMWPEHVWDQAAGQMADEAARYGDYHSNLPYQAAGPLTLDDAYGNPYA
jgi:hypothetical protein